MSKHNNIINNNRDNDDELVLLQTEYEKIMKRLNEIKDLLEEKKNNINNKNISTPRNIPVVKEAIKQQATKKITPLNKKQIIPNKKAVQVKKPNIAKKPSVAKNKVTPAKKKILSNKKKPVIKKRQQINKNIKQTKSLPNNTKKSDVINDIIANKNIAKNKVYMLSKKQDDFPIFPNDFRYVAYLDKYLDFYIDNINKGSGILILYDGSRVLKQIFFSINNNKVIFDKSIDAKHNRISSSNFGRICIREKKTENNNKYEMIVYDTIITVDEENIDKIKLILSVPALIFDTKKIHTNTKQICVCHIGYDELIREMLKYMMLINIQTEFIITFNTNMVTTTPLIYNKKKFLKLCRNNKEFNKYIDFPTLLPKCKFILLRNKGTDIGPFLKSYELILNRNMKCDYILKIHSKKNDQWRRDMLNSLIIDTDKKIANFDSEHCGMLGNKTIEFDYLNFSKIVEQYEFLGLPINMTFDKKTIMKLKHQLKGSMRTLLQKSQNKVYEFIPGTCFWIKNDILYNNRKIIELYDTMSDGFSKDYTYQQAEHAMERLFCLLTIDSGYKICVV